MLTGAQRGDDDRKLRWGPGRILLHAAVLQLRLLVRRPRPAAGHRRRRHRARHRRPRPEHGARLAVRRAAAAGPRPHRLLLHRAQLPPRLTAAAQDHGADGRGRRGIVSARGGGQHRVHRRRRERPGGHARRSHRGRGTHRGRRLAAAGRHRGHLHGRLSLLLHRAQLPPRLAAPAQDHGADGRRRRRVVSAGEAANTEFTEDAVADLAGHARRAHRGGRAATRAASRRCRPTPSTSTRPARRSSPPCSRRWRPPSATSTSCTSSGSRTS